MAKLSVWSDGSTMVVAESAQDACLATNESLGGEEVLVEDFEPLPEDRSLPIGYDDEKAVPPGATDEERKALRMVRTCAEWIEINGRGVLASMDY